MTTQVKIWQADKIASTRTLKNRKNL